MVIHMHKVTKIMVETENHLIVQKILSMHNGKLFDFSLLISKDKVKYEANNRRSMPNFCSNETPNVCRTDNVAMRHRMLNVMYFTYSQRKKRERKNTRA